MLMKIKNRIGRKIEKEIEVDGWYIENIIQEKHKTRFLDRLGNVIIVVHLRSLRTLTKVYYID